MFSLKLSFGCCIVIFFLAFCGPLCDNDVQYSPIFWSALLASPMFSLKLNFGCYIVIFFLAFCEPLSGNAVSTSQLFEAIITMAQLFTVVAYSKKHLCFSLGHSFPILFSLIVPTALSFHSFTIGFPYDSPFPDYFLS